MYIIPVKNICIAWHRTYFEQCCFQPHFTFKLFLYLFFLNLSSKPDISLSPGFSLQAPHAPPQNKTQTLSSFSQCGSASEIPLYILVFASVSCPHCPSVNSMTAGAHLSCSLLYLPPCVSTSSRPDRLQVPDKYLLIGQKGSVIFMVLAVPKVHMFKIF